MIFKSAVKHDGVRYEKGTEVPADFDEKSLAVLVRDGVCGEVEEVVAEEATDATEDTSTPSIKWSKGDLLAYASEHGITVDAGANKATILAAIVG